MPKSAQPLWKDYLSSLAVAYGVALFFCLLMPKEVGPHHEPMSWLQIGFVGLVSGTFFGNAFFVVGFFMPKARFRSFWLTILVRSLIIGLTMLLGMMVLFPLFFVQFGGLSGNPWSAQNLALIQRAIPFSVLFYWVLVGLGISVVINAAHQVNRKLGPGIIPNWITGKYHSPREEERIFMFLDLKNSTSLAERLGNLRFSRLCQDFFMDLTGPIVETRGEVSHYIGDEAVLTWKPKRGLEKANCIRCFDLMREAVANRAEHYRRAYGIVPEFKAGVHLGLVVAAEVGEVKSEIVFHGDVLNTTARITGLCSELGCDLLISGDLKGRLTLPNEQLTSFGPRLLKGKEHEVEVYGIGSVSPTGEPIPVS